MNFQKARKCERAWLVAGYPRRIEFAGYKWDRVISFNIALVLNFASFNLLFSLLRIYDYVLDGKLWKWKCIINHSLFIIFVDFSLVAVNITYRKVNSFGASYAQIFVRDHHKNRLCGGWGEGRFNENERRNYGNTFSNFWYPSRATSVCLFFFVLNRRKRKRIREEGAENNGVELGNIQNVDKLITTLCGWKKRVPVHIFHKLKPIKLYSQHTFGPPFLSSVGEHLMLMIRH